MPHNHKPLPIGFDFQGNVLQLFAEDGSYPVVSNSSSGVDQLLVIPKQPRHATLASREKSADTFLLSANVACLQTYFPDCPCRFDFLTPWTQPVPEFLPCLQVY